MRRETTSDVCISQGADIIDKARQVHLDSRILYEAVIDLASEGVIMDFTLGYDIFSFMIRLISCTLKTNYYKPVKRSFCFRLDNQILDPLAFNRFGYGIN